MSSGSCGYCHAINQTVGATWLFRSLKSNPSQEAIQYYTKNKQSWTEPPRRVVKIMKRDKVQRYVPAESKMEQSWFLPSKSTVYCQCFKLIKVKTFQFIRMTYRDKELVGNLPFKFFGQIWGIYDNQHYQLGFIYLVSGDSTIALDRSAIMKQMLLSTSISQLFRCYYRSKNPTLLIHHHEH